MNPFIEIQHLSKSFGDLVLLDDISFSIAEGQHIGIIAKNGFDEQNYEFINFVENIKFKIIFK